MPPKKHRLLLTNDDGIDAPGLATLIDIAHDIADEVWVVAPQQEQSGVSQAVTLNAPLRCVARGEKKWAVSGTPSDCVVLALSHLMKHTPPDMILSGINSGSNTGDHLHTSGTAGAAFTGLMYGCPSIALSLAHGTSRKNMRWETASAVLPDILANFLHEGWDKGHCLSINIPDLPPENIKGISWTHLARKTTPDFTVDHREDLREKDYYWILAKKNESTADTNSDVAALARGQISITALTLDRSLTVMAAPFGKKTANDE